MRSSLVWMRSSLVWMRSSRVWMRSSPLVRASDSQYRSPIRSPIRGKKALQGYQKFSWVSKLEFGSGSNSDPGFWCLKIGRKKCSKKFSSSLFDQKLQFTYVQAAGEAFIQPSKKNIQHVKKWNLLTFFYVCESFYLPSWIRIRIQGPHWIRIRDHNTAKNISSPQRINCSTRTCPERSTHRSCCLAQGRPRWRRPLIQEDRQLVTKLL